MTFQTCQPSCVFLQCHSAGCLSCGLIPLVDTIEEKLFEATHKRLFHMRLPTGGLHLRLLLSVAGTAKSTPCAYDPNKSEIVAALSDKQLAVFCKLCRSLNSNLLLNSRVLLLNKLILPCSYSRFANFLVIALWT
ncbi:hypothetical protein FHG87_021782 [Trinorchestia longiramus]|nr:hypothetical protein FHG87_021782 [Trinorchestia longiramus]